MTRATPHPPGYRADVDALRAVAVVAVFLFHLDIDVVSGGFVGVDVFYAISGYVIFRTVLQDVAADRFSLRAFWRRRLCRILPALLLTVLACTAVGWWLMTPAEYAEFGNSALSAILSVSNFYFNDRLQYFGATAREVPLVHTWSLGVEEQFYLTAPLLILWLVRRRAVGRLLPVLGVLVLLSFAYNLFALYGLANERHAFYLPMARFWEIAVGGVIACWERRRTGDLPFREPLAWAGVAGIVAACLLIDTNTPFPGFAVLLPVGATALFLASGLRTDSPGGRAFQAAPLVFLGRISYSTYLFHWPAIAFYTIATGQDLDAGSRIAIVAGTLALAALSWRWIETPFRQAHRRRPGARPVVVLVGSAGVLAALALALPLWDGLPQRLNAAARQKLAMLQRPEPTPPLSCQRIARLTPVEKAGVCSVTPQADRFHYLLWGDSHAGMYHAALSETLHPAGKTGVLATMPDCPALIGVYTSKRKNRAECQALQKHIEALVADERIPVVVLGGRWANLASDLRAPGDGGIPKTVFDAEHDGDRIPFAAALERTVRRLRTTGARVVVVGPVPEIDFSVPAMLVRTTQLGNALPTASRRDFDRRQAQVLAALHGLESWPGVRVVYPHHQLCDAAHCRIASGADPLYRDDDHLSHAGNRLVAPMIAAAILDAAS